MRKINIWGSILFFCAASILGSSCINQKSITYFNNLPDSTLIPLQSLSVSQQLIHVNDALSIKIGGENEKTTSYIASYLGGVSAAGSQGNTYQVGSDGNVELPKIGVIKVSGLTRDQARDTITSAYKEYLIDPIVSVDFTGFRFTIIGEVRAPGVFNVATQQVNIFEALAQAGDMTEFARKENVKIIRDSANTRKIISLNFNDKSILNSPYYYLNRYDILYVEPKNIKLSTENFNRSVGILSGLIGIVTIFLVIFKN